MTDGKRSTSTSKAFKSRHCGADMCMVSNEPNLREKVVTGGTGIELCLIEKNDVVYDYFLKPIASTSTSFSMDSSDCSENMSVEDDKMSASVEMQSSIQKEDTDFDCSIKRVMSTSTTLSMDSSDSSEITSLGSLFNVDTMDTDTNSISTADFEDGSANASVVMQSTIQKEDTSINTAEYEYYRNYEHYKLSASELASKRLYFMAVERSKRILILGETLSELTDKRHYTNSTRIDNARSVRKNGSEAMSSVKCVPDTNSTANCVKKGRHPKTVRRSSVIQTKDNKLNKDSDKGMGQGKDSPSKVVRYRLYLEGIERKKRPALLRKEHHKPNLPLESVLERKRIDTNGFECDSNSVEHFQQLYALSKPLQEDGKNRRKSIEEASTKRNEVRIHPSEKIAIADSARLYYMGMRQNAALERRRIEASEPGEYMSRLSPVPSSTKCLIHPCTED